MVNYDFDHGFNLLVPDDLYHYADKRFSSIVERCVKPHCVKLDNINLFGEYDLMDGYYQEVYNLPDLNVYLEDFNQIDEFFNAMEKEFL